MNKPAPTTISGKALAIGAALGVQLGYLLLVVALPLLGVTRADAATAVDTSGCMSANECNRAMDGKDLCQLGDGCCVGDRCFVPDASCPKSQADKQGRCYAKSPPFQLALSLGGKQSVLDISDYLNTLYQVALAAAMLVAAVMMTIGGFQYMTSGGGAGVTAAKKRITDAVIGLFVLLSAFLILQTISPDLISLRMPKVPVVKREYFLPCTQTAMCRSCGEAYGLSRAYVETVVNGNAADAKLRAGANLNNPCDSKNIIEPTDTARAGDIAANCNGSSCGCGSGGSCADSEYRCRKRAKSDEVADCSTPLKTVAGQPITPPAAAGATATPPLYLCMQCAGDGGACSPNGQNDKCCSGFCADSKCSGGQSGDSCCKTIAESATCKNQCESGICQTNFGNVCSSGDVGMPCGASDSECRSGFKCQTSGKNICVPGTAFNPCAETKECATGYTCQDLQTTLGSAYSTLAKVAGTVVGGVVGLRTGGLVGAGVGASVGGQNASGSGLSSGARVCLPNGFQAQVDCTNAAHACTGSYPYCFKGGAGTQDFCTNGELGSVCQDNDGCESKHCVDLFGASYFPYHQKVCTSGIIGARCSIDDDCDSKRCFQTSVFGTCVSGAAYSPCNGNESDCLQNLTCTNKRCIPKSGCAAK